MPVRRKARTILVAATTLSAGALLLAPTSMASAQEGSAPSGRTTEVQALGNVQGPFGIEHECRIVNGEFQRYYQTRPCWFAALPEVGWYFHFYPK
jgi:hypothetical protein